MNLQIPKEGLVVTPHWQMSGWATRNPAVCLWGRDRYGRSEKLQITEN